MKEIGERIRQLRIKRNLKQTELASALMVSPQAVSKWERAESCPDIDTLPELARILNVSTDYLLGVTDADQGVFEATVLCSSINQFARKSVMMESREVAEWSNVIFHHLTEAALQYDAVPVKYVGDGFLCFFSGPAHASRALRAARRAKRIVQNAAVIIALNSGDIYLGTIGHPDYSSRDICGPSVNLAFLILDHVAQRCPSGIGFTQEVVDRLDEPVPLQRHQGVYVDRLQSEIELFELDMKEERGTPV